MNKFVTISFIVLSVLDIFVIGWVLEILLNGFNQDFHLHLNLVLIILIGVVSTILLAIGAFIWVWWTASEGNFGN